jgi:hypothetical protein
MKDTRNHKQGSLHGSCECCDGRRTCIVHPTPDDATRAAQERVQCAYVLGYEPLCSPWSERQSTDRIIIFTMGTLSYISVIHGQYFNTHKRRRSKMKLLRFQHDTARPSVGDSVNATPTASNGISPEPYHIEDHFLNQ